MGLFSMCVISPSILVVSVLGQSLSVPLSTTDLKTPGVFFVTIDSPKGKAPVIGAMGIVRSTRDRR